MTEARDYLERRWWALALLCMTQFMVVLDASMAIIAPSALSIVTTIFRDGSERNKALGAWGAVAGSGGAAGVLLGGVLTDGLGWEWVMWVNVPVALIVLALAPSLIPESRSESQTRHFDLAGAVTVTAGLSLLVYAIVDAESAGWDSTQTIGLLAAAVALLGVFAAVELRSQAPLVPFRIFQKRTLTGANAVGLMDGGFTTDILGPSLLAAVGLGFAFVTTTIAAVSGIQDQEQGLASGLINTSQQIGGALGLAVLATIANSRTD